MITDNEAVFQPKCFVRAVDLECEYWNSSRTGAQSNKHSSAILGIIDAERKCDAFTIWMQGFHPKEHRDIIFQDELRKAERRHASISLAVAVFAALATAVGGAIGAYFSLQGARLGADATRESAKWQVEALQKQTEAQSEMTKIQIEAQREIAKTTPVPRVIVRMPPLPR